MALTHPSPPSETPFGCIGVGWRLHNGQRNALNLLINVQCKEVGHAADVIDDGLNARSKLRAVDVVLAAKALYQLSRIISLRLRGGRPK